MSIQAEELGLPRKSPSVVLTEGQKLFQSIHLGVGFFFLFSAYSTTQDLLSSLFKDYGLYALIIIYGGFVFSSFFSGFILSKTGTRVGLVLGAGLYTSFIGLIQAKIAWLFLLGSGLVALGAGPLWLANGVYLSRITQDDKSTIGKYNGIFNAVFIGSSLVGNLTIGLLFQFTKDSNGNVPDHIRDITIWILFALGAFGTVVLALLRPVPHSAEPEAQSVKDKILAVVYASSKREMMVWMPYLFAASAGSSFQWGVFPQMIEVAMVPWVFAVAGAMSIITSPIVGKVLDRFSCFVALTMHVVVLLLAYGFVVLYTHYGGAAFYFPAYAMFGVSDAIMNTMGTAMLMKDLPDMVTGALATNRMLGSLGAALMLVVQVILKEWWQIVIIVGVLYSLAFVAVFAFRADPATTSDGKFDEKSSLIPVGEETK